MTLCCIKLFYVVFNCIKLYCVILNCVPLCYIVLHRAAGVLTAATSGGAVVTLVTHKRGSERCMKWRKMADHVQVSGGFMFLSRIISVGGRS